MSLFFSIKFNFFFPWEALLKIIQVNIFSASFRLHGSLGSDFVDIFQFTDASTALALTDISLLIATGIGI